MFKFLLSVIWGVVKILLIATVVLVVLFLASAKVHDFLSYSVFSCVDKNLIFTASEAISHIKKHIEIESLDDYSYMSASISSDYNKTSRNAGTDRGLGD